MKKSSAAFGRLCVETLGCVHFVTETHQPPSGGCVLKQLTLGGSPPRGAAAFGRLCVETHAIRSENTGSAQPPSGGCVLKRNAVICEIPT